MKIAQTNILKISDWKDLQADMKEEKSLMKYLKVLNFHDLMIEAEQARKDINSSNINKEITLRSKAILKEFTNRLKADHDGFSTSLDSLGKSIENKFSKLKELV